MERTGLTLHNSLGKKKMTFEHRNEVRIFTCGPSIYQRPHIGNYRTFLFEDILVRYLIYRGMRVKRAMNITDVEDKAILESMKRELDVSELTRRNEEDMLREWELLRMRMPDMLPRASGSVPRSVEIIKLLLKKGMAYRYKNDIFYDPLKFSGFGRLYGLDMNEWPKRRMRFSKDTYPGMRWNRGDFILWHGCSEEDRVCWDEELGSGRPSWNVQDGAMVLDTLGPSIDIWCGGEDNLIRHHDYNIAVVEGYSGEELSPFWLHGAHLLVDGKKMSKSAGNVIYPEDLIEKGYDRRHIRFFLIEGHYSRRMNMTYDAFERSGERLDGIRGSICGLLAGDGPDLPGNTSIIEGMPKGFAENMDDDLNVGGALTALEEGLKELEREGISKRQASKLKDVLLRIDSVLEVLFDGGNLR
ncbi:MAG: class I tRNA ligase family protein [Candidatus Thermoplasmatota archaeon]|nr:class I tRNA ligase family protein [Candidatus Thermoplasmatota archaeon]